MMVNLDQFEVAQAVSSAFGHGFMAGAGACLWVAFMVYLWRRR
jgi:hypothetical protein